MFSNEPVREQFGTVRNGGEDMIKLQDFAKQCGVTDRAIQKQLKKHEEALTGHFERQGANGTWLDEYAQNFLRSNMVKKTVAIADQSQLKEIERLKAELKAAQDELILKNQLLINSQNEVLKITANREEEIKAAEDKLKLEMESQRREAENKLKEHYLGEVKDLQRKLEQYQPTWFGFYRKKE